MPTATTIGDPGTIVTKNRATGHPIAQVGEKSADGKLPAIAVAFPADADIFAPGSTQMR